MKRLFERIKSWFASLWYRIKLMANIKAYQGRHTGKQIDDLLGKVPGLVEDVSAMKDRVSDKNYVKDFYNTKTITITHDLGKRPSVTVLDVDGNSILCDVRIYNDSIITVSFGNDETGTIILN